MELQSQLKEFNQAGISVAAISYDSVEILQRFSRRSNITFPLLSDPKSQTIDSFNLRNKESDRGIPHPGIVILDKDGILVGKLFFQGYKERHTAAQILEAVKELRSK